MAEFPNENSSPQDLNDSLTGATMAEKKRFSAFSSVDNSPMMDRDSLMRYSVSSRDEFWDALSSNYDYLMDDGLINTCREASSDLSLDDENELPEANCWTFTSFIEQFKELHDLLHDLQVNQDKMSLESEEGRLKTGQHNIRYMCQLFNDQAQKLCKRYPDMRDEVHRRLNILNNKWKAVEQSNPSIVKSPSNNLMFGEISSRMNFLRKWLRAVESQLVPISSSDDWPADVLEEKLRVQNALQKEIEGKSKSVSVLLKLCEHLEGIVHFRQNALKSPWDAEQVRQVAKNLEHRFHTLWIHSLERQCVLEELLGAAKGGEKLEKSFSEEPLKKYPRLGDKIESIENEIKSMMNSPDPDRVSEAIRCSPQKSLTMNDKGVMVGDTGIAELKASKGKFEIIQDIGYSSETSAHLSEKGDSPENSFGSPPRTSLVGYLAPDKYPSVSLKAFQALAEDRNLCSARQVIQKRMPETFYQVACIDEDAFEGTFAEQACEDRLEWTEDPSLNKQDLMRPHQLKASKKQDIDFIPSLTPRFKDVCDAGSLPCSRSSGTPKTHRSGKEQITSQVLDLSGLHSSTPSSVDRRSRLSPSVSPEALQKSGVIDPTARVSEWLNTCQPSVEEAPVAAEAPDQKERSESRSDVSVNSGCDASGECTTNESDSDKSNVSDVNNSVTLSQSFTGSIETVIPVVPDDSSARKGDHSVGLEPTPNVVRLRKKKRSTRDRPWSVIELTESFPPSSVPHSTSEGALDLLYAGSQDSNKAQKKLSRKSKRLSLTDMSSASCLSKKSHRFNQKLVEQSNVLPSRARTESDCSKGSGGLQVVDRVLVDVVTDDLTNRDNLTGVQVILSETNSLPETSFSVDTDATGCTASIEDQGSISDQAWDEYQDPPYLSEPYSEATMDEDEVRKLICFGDDYRASLGSYSDASSISLRLPPRSRTRTRSTLTKSAGEGTFSSDSNSDSEDFNHILKTSNKAYKHVMDKMEKSSKFSISSSDLAELVATCQANLCHLQDIANASPKLECVPKEDLLKLKNLIMQWEELTSRVLSLNNDKESKAINVDIEAATVDVHTSLATLKEKLTGMAEQASEAIDKANTLETTDSNIQNLQNALSTLQEIKSSVLLVNARILRLITENGGHSLPFLKESATKLYQQWEDVYELNCVQLTKLQNLRANWGQSTEEELGENQETTVQFQPVQVGNNLPKAEVIREDLHESTAAEVQVADQLDMVSEMPADSFTQCIPVEKKRVGKLERPIKAVQRSVKDSEVAKRQPSRPKSCLWRIIFASVPIQLVLLILYCLSCFMEPQCCENANSYDFSILPKLRYPYGPPPV